MAPLPGDAVLCDALRSAIGGCSRADRVNGSRFLAEAVIAGGNGCLRFVVDGASAVATPGLCADQQLNWLEIHYVE
jgi:hypothetical protein